MVGLDARFGVQLDPLSAVLLQPAALVGAGVRHDLSGTSVGAEATALGLLALGVLYEATPVDFFSLGVGPEVVHGGIGTARAGVSGGTSVGTDVGAEVTVGNFFGVAGRAVFSLGRFRPERRRAFQLGLALHVVVTEEPLFVPLLTLGYESF